MEDEHDVKDGLVEDLIGYGSEDHWDSDDIMADHMIQKALQDRTRSTKQDKYIAREKTYTFNLGQIHN